MKSNIQEEIIDLNELLQTAVDLTEYSPVPASNARASEATLPQPVETPAEQNQLPADEAVQPVVTELRSLLNHLKLIEGALTQGGDIQRTVVVFKLIHQRTLSLIEKIDLLMAQWGTSHEALRVALDTTTFALKHEMRRVYEVEAKGLCGTGNVQFSRSALTRAYGLMQNCFQQSVITLMQVFEPHIRGGRAVRGI